MPKKKDKSFDLLASIGKSKIPNEPQPLEQPIETPAEPMPRKAKPAAKGKGKKQPTKKK